MKCFYMGASSSRGKQYYSNVSCTCTVEDPVYSDLLSPDEEEKYAV